MAGCDKAQEQLSYKRCLSMMAEAVELLTAHRADMDGLAHELIGHSSNPLPNPNSNPTSNDNPTKKTNVCIINNMSSLIQQMVAEVDLTINLSKVILKPISLRALESVATIDGSSCNEPAENISHQLDTIIGANNIIELISGAFSVALSDIGAEQPLAKKSTNPDGPPQAEDGLIKHMTIVLEDGLLYSIKSMTNRTGKFANIMVS